MAINLKVYGMSYVTRQAKSGKSTRCNDLSVTSITYNVSLPLYMLCLHRKDFIKLMAYGKDKKLMVKNVYYV